MDWRGRFTVALALAAVVVAFSIATFSGAAPRPEPERLGAYAPFKVGDGLPGNLGPAIVDATYRDVGNDNSLANDTLYVVFNKDVNPATVGAADFAFNSSAGGVGKSGGFVADVSPMYPNVVRLAGFTAEPTTTDSLQLSGRGVIAASGGVSNINEDVSLIHINTGPVITRVDFIAGYDTQAISDDVLRVWYTHVLNTATLSTANAKLDFDMPEFGSDSVNPVEVAAAGKRYVDVSFDAAAVTTEDYHFGRVKAGVSVIRMVAAGVVSGHGGAGDVTDVLSASTRWVTVRAAGPVLLEAGYNNRGTVADSSDDILTLVFNRDIPSNILLDMTDLGLSTAPGADFSPSLSSMDGDHEVRFTNMKGSNIAPGTTTISVSPAVLDFQGNPAVGNAVTVRPSPILVLARYNDGGDATLSTDNLELIFDTPVTGSTADTSSFNFFGFSNTGLQVTDNNDNDSLLVLTGFTAGNTWTPGDRVQIRPGAALAGWRAGVFVPGDAYAGRAIDPVRDGSAPRTLLFQQNIFYTRDTRTIASPTDTAFVALNELGTDDAGYYLFFTRKSDPVDILYAQSHFNNAAWVTDPSPGPGSLDKNIITTYDITPGTGIYSNGQPIDSTDVVRFGVLAADLEGNVAFLTPSNLFFGGLVAGPTPCPVDFIAGEDDDIIHVWSNGITRFVGGDPNAVLSTNVDSVRVYGTPGYPTGTLLGSGQVNSDGSFGPIDFGNYTGDTIYLVSIDDFGSPCGVGTAILNDTEAPEVLAAVDPLNNMNEAACYSGGDTLRVVASLSDPTGGNPALNDLLLVYADLTGFVKTAGADSVTFISLGANQIDDNNNWIDVAVNGAVNPTFTGNGKKDFPEPYVDENGNGQWDPGETFVDVNGTDYRPHLYDYGDQNLDSSDPAEHGRYFVKYAFATADLVADPQGFNNFAVLEDVPVVLHAKDNAVSSQAILNAITENAPTTADLSASVPSFSLTQESVNDSVLTATEDSQAPTVSEISFLERQTSATNATGNPADNIIEPGDHVYKLAAGVVNPYFNLADSTLSDDDVAFVGLQIDPVAGSSSSANFQWLSFDPAGDANTDGMPGIAGYDDDGDSVATVTNGLDDDEDGVNDNLEEGTDLHDAQVVDAMQADAYADAQASGGDGISRVTDLRDNDNDAFFRYNVISGQWVWFNIDESDSNGVDDDGNGVVDDASEVETYNPATDDDEDGIDDGSAVAITVSAGQYLPNPAYSGPIWVAGFSDPSMIAKYAGTPAASKPADFNTYADGLTANDGTPGKRDVNSMVTHGADNFGAASWAYGAGNIISYASITGGGGVPVNNGGTAFAFDYRAQNGRNLNMKVIKSLYGLNDGDTYRLRAVAYDKCYQGNPDWAVPLKFSVDSTAPEVSIPPPPFDDFVDTNPSMDGLQICDVDGNMAPKTYTLQADLVSGDVNDVASVDFQMWDAGTKSWTTIGTDTSSPFTLQWTYAGAPIGNMPPARQDTVYFRTIATDKFGNVEPQALCDSLYTDATATTPCFELQAIITDCTPPMSCLCQIGSDYDVTDGAFVPLESAVDISACFTDGDGDSTTNDVVRIEFQYRPVGTTTWQSLPSLTGVPVDTTGDGIPDVLVDVTGIKHPIISTGPDTLVATVTWDTHGLAAGSYDLRAIAFDIEGNNNANMACVATATLDNIGLRAYMQPCVPTANPGTDSLFANVYIHDTAVKKVEFQYYADTNGDGQPNDGSSWVSIDTQGDVAGERKGDVVLRAGFAHVETLAGANHASLANYRFYDVDGDGYNPVDPVYNTVSGTYSGQTPVFSTGTTPANGATLSAFATGEYFADVNTNGTLDTSDWLMLDNRLNGAGDNQVDLWSTAWSVAGLNGSYLTRAVATDEFGNVDDDANHDGVPDTDTNIWFEQCTIDSQAPTVCVTSYIPADGSAAVALPAGPVCPQVSPQDSLTFVAETTGGTTAADIDSVRFFYSLDGGVTWTWFATDIVGPDWTAVFHYGDMVFPTDTEANVRAIAYDHAGNFDSDPNLCKACLVLSENKGPETDIVYIVTAEGDTLDANTVLRGSADAFCLQPTTITMLVTAEDTQAIDRVEIWYRKVAGLTASDTTSWAMVPGLSDSSYPYTFAWDLNGLADGVYEFFPRGFDANGNMTPVFGNPFRFSLNHRTATVASVEKNGVPVTSLTPGEEVVVKGTLDDPTDTQSVTVNFWYAERIQGEVLDVSTSYPYTATTSHTIYADNTAGMHGNETVNVNGVEAMWYSTADFAALATKTKTDYTITGPNTLVFGGAMAATDSVTIDYDVTTCQMIATGDEVAPYSVAWDADSPGGLVPVPSISATTAYDIIATATRNFAGFDGCAESCFSEGFVLPIADTSAPMFTVWGLDYRNPNFPGNPLCESVGGTDVSGDFGSSKSKLSGIEEQFFVTPAQQLDKAKLAGNGVQIPLGDDGSDWASVTMSVAGNPAVTFTKFTADSDSVVTLPITFYIDDMASVMANGKLQAINPDSVENVTISIPGISVTNAEMTDNGDGTFSYMATLPLGATYAYSFSVDLVGDDQVTNIADPRNAGSSIVLPDVVWIYSTTDPGALFGLNQLRQTVVTVTDDQGNASTNLMSGGVNGGALGQIWNVYDNVPEKVTKFWASQDVVAPGATVQFNAEVHDPVDLSADIIRVKKVVIQASVDDTNGRWRTLLTDTNNGDWNTLHTDDGGWGGTVTLPGWMDPLHDGIDNNRDGVTDDASEAVYTYKLRVVTVDDCFNTGYSCSHPRAQDPQVCGEITVDSGIPQACLESPTDGTVIKIGDTVDLVATSSDTDLDHVQFEYSLDGGQNWNVIDPTPLNSDDDPWVSAAGEDGKWHSSWNTGFLAENLAGDFYVTLRARAVDKAGNDQGDDPELNCHVNVILNDQTGPVSAITRFYAGCFPNDPLLGGNYKKPFDPTLALSHTVTVFGRATGWNAHDVATVVVQVSQDQTTWTDLAVINEFNALPGPLLAAWQFDWNTDVAPYTTEGTWYLRSYATDADGNVQGDTNNDGTPDELPVIPVTIDHTAPHFVLTQVGPEGANGTTLDDHDNIRPDMLDQMTDLCPDAGQITFVASLVDQANDVEAINGMSLQFYDDVTDPENPRWVDLGGELGGFQYRDAAGDSQNPDGKWRLEVPSVSALGEAMRNAVGSDLPAKEYRFRVLATDYACNSNDDSEGIWLRLDDVDPIVTYIYAGNKQFEAGSGAEGNSVHVAGGDTVPLAARINDGLWWSYPSGEWPDDHTIKDESAGLYAVQFSYIDGQGHQNVIGLGTLDDMGTPDGADDLWKIDWVTPENLAGSTDSTYTIVVAVRDSSGNCGSNSASGIVTVQDVTPPQDTQLIAVQADDDCNTYPRTPLFGLTIGEEHQDGIGIDETVLTQDLTGAKTLGTVARGVTLYAATPQGDASMDGGHVYFEGRRLDASKPNAAGPWIPIGEGECVYRCGEFVYEPAPGVTGAASHMGPIWATEWNTLAQNPDGSRTWFDPSTDGTLVQVRVRSVDAWGNAEVNVDDAIYRLVVDNTAPTVAVALKNPANGATVTQVERNDKTGVVIEATGGSTDFVNNDLTVTFYYKLKTDLNDANSWVLLDPQNGFAPTNDNPDETRPYSFAWNTNGHRDPDGNPLVANATYDVSVAVQDLVCNTTSVVQNYANSVDATLKVVDTKAPQASIVAIGRDYDGADCYVDENSFVWNPDNARVNGVDVLLARILDGSTDTQDVKFYYRAAGTSAWTLADGDITMKDLDSIQTWTLSEWSTSPLAEGAYELAAIATDDAGNTDAAPAVTRIIIDRTGPAFTAVTPKNDQIIVPENVASNNTDAVKAGIQGLAGSVTPTQVCDPAQRVADLIATTPDADVAYKDSWNNCVNWQWKWSAQEDVDENWHDFDAMTLFDSNLSRYSSTVDLLAEFGHAAGLVDWRVVATDVAGNTTKKTVAAKTIVDNVAPDVEVTNFHVSTNDTTTDDTTIEPINNGQITDVSAGNTVTVYATVDDDEPNLPADHETGVSEVQFFVRPVGGDWGLLGTAGYDAVHGLWKINWNTTGLAEGDYEVKARATDEAANCGDSHTTVTVSVRNVATPLAQVSAFNPDLLSYITKGTNDRVYGLTFGEKEAATVFFQYRPVGTTDWTTIGTAMDTGVSLVTRQAGLIPQDLWYAQLRTSNFASGQMLEFRAVATDALPAKPGDGDLSLKGALPGQGGIVPLAGDTQIFSGLYDLANTPVLTMRVDRAEDGSTKLTPTDTGLGYITNLGVWVTGSTLQTGRIEVSTGDATIAPFVVVVGEDGTGAIAEAIPEMDRKADDNKVWAGEAFDIGQHFTSLDPTQGAILSVYATASKKRTDNNAPAPKTQMVMSSLIFHQVTPNKGSNGVAGVDGRGLLASDGYPTDAFDVSVPAGAFSSNYGLLIKRTDMPVTPEWQDRYIDTVGQAFRTSLHNSNWTAANVLTAAGYDATVWVRYDPADLNGASQSKLTVRRWSGNSTTGWTGAGVQNVVVDTTAHVIRFNTNDIASEVWAVVTTDKTAPVEIVASPEWSGYTDQDPILRGVIRSAGGDIDDNSIELYLDGKLAATTYSDYVLYPGSNLSVSPATSDGQVYGWEYQHTCSNNDALKEGAHTARIVFKDDSGKVYGSDYTFNFMVDRTAPYIEFHGGFVGSPKLTFAAGYTNLNQNILTVRMFDGGSGLLFREDRIDDLTSNDNNECEQENAEELCELYGSLSMDCDELVPGDGGFKYDVWVIDDCVSCGQGSQLDIDNQEQRTLLYTGTADALAPYITPSLSEYTPGDTLNVPLAVLTGGHRLHDGAVLEITLYSDKVTVGGQATVSADLQAALDAMKVFGPIKYDAAGQEYTVYTRGPMDNVFNAGSRFVEQRFIVDMTPPVVVPSSPGVACDGGTATPVEQTDHYTFTASFQDAGVGVDPSTVTVKVMGPNGNTIAAEPEVTENGVSVNITNGGNLLAPGTYSVTISGQDKLGNKFSSTCTFQVGADVIKVSGAEVIPNPFNPLVGNATIHFDVTRPADVEVTAYDWAGDYVATIFKGTKGIGPVNLEWSGQTEDGRALANGVYIVRIVVSDGSRQEPKVLKVAIWNER